MFASLKSATSLKLSLSRHRNLLIVGHQSLTMLSLKSSVKPSTIIHLLTSCKSITLCTAMGNATSVCSKLLVQVASMARMSAQ